MKQVYLVCKTSAKLKLQLQSKNCFIAKSKRNMTKRGTIYNPRDLSNAHQLECWTCELTLVMHSIATMSLVTCYFWLTLLLVNMQCHITSLFSERNITIHNV